MDDAWQDGGVVIEGSKNTELIAGWRRCALDWIIVDEGQVD